MSYDEVLGLLVGIGTLLAVIGYLAAVYRQPQRFQWLELPQGRRGETAAFAKAPPARRTTA